MKFSDIAGMLERDEMREIIGGSGSTTGSGSNIYGGGGNAPALGSNPFNSSFSGTNYGGFGGSNVVGGGVYGSGSITGAGESSYQGSPYYNGSSGSSGNSNNLGSSTLNSGYGGGWYTSYNNGKTTNDPLTIDRFFQFVYANSGIVSNNQINAFVNNELSSAGQQQNNLQYNLQLPGTVLNNVPVTNNYKGPSTIPQGVIVDNMSLFINTSSDSSGTSGNNAAWYAMPKYIHSSISEPSPLEAAFMSKAVYGDFVSTQDLNGWMVSKAVPGLMYSDSASGFKSQLYERTINGRKEYCYATAGTELEVGDIAADVLQTVGISLQYEQSINNAKALKMILGDAVSFTGHSLGGGMAEANARATGESATTFNAAGLSYATTVLLGISFVSDTDAYIMKTDPLNLLQKNTPILTTAGGTQHFISAGSQAGAMNGHSIDSVIESLTKNKGL